MIYIIYTHIYTHTYIHTQIIINSLRRITCSCSLSIIVYNNFTVCYKQQYSVLHIHIHFLPIGSIGWFSQYTRGQ